jgi:prevent-host-death family protein
MEVGVRELKKRLSEYLELAAGGEVIRVTHRGRAKALLGPVSGGTGEIQRGIAEGWISAGEAEPPVAVRRAPASRLSDEVLAEDRG